jgi:hypothetical protein
LEDYWANEAGMGQQEARIHHCQMMKKMMMMTTTTTMMMTIFCYNANHRS